DFQGHIAAFETLPGGNATNFALQIARLGAKTTFVGVLGRDANAHLLREAYRRQGVRALVRTDAGHPTGATVALSWTGGGRALITSLGANGELRLRDVPAKILKQVDHLHRAGFWWTPRLMGRPTALLLSRARHAGVGTSLDMSTDPFGLTRRTSTPGSEAIPSPRRCVSRTPVRPCISGTVGIRTPGSQTSVGSSPRDSPGPRQIFTFTHPPLPSALITHAGDGEAMALASVHTHSSVPPGAWAMLGR